PLQWASSGPNRNIHFPNAILPMRVPIHNRGSIPSRGEVHVPNVRSERETNPKNSLIPRCYHIRSSPNDHWCCKVYNPPKHAETRCHRNCGHCPNSRVVLIHRKINQMKLQHNLVLEFWRWKTYSKYSSV